MRQNGQKNSAVIPKVFCAQLSEEIYEAGRADGFDQIYKINVDIFPSVFQFVNVDGSGRSDGSNSVVCEIVDYVAGDSSGLLAEVIYPIEGCCELKKPDYFKYSVEPEKIKTAKTLTTTKKALFTAFLGLAIRS